MIIVAVAVAIAVIVAEGVTSSEGRESLVGNEVPRRQAGGHQLRQFYLGVRDERRVAAGPHSIR